MGEGWGIWFPAPPFILLRKICGRSADIVVDIVCPTQPAWEQQPPQKPENVTGAMKINFACMSQKRSKTPRSAPEIRGTWGNLPGIWQTLKNPV